jgi:hypothetical protein
MSYSQEGMTDYTEEVNWEEVGQPIPIGNFDFVVDAAQYKPTKEGKHMINMSFKVVNAYDEDHESAVGRTVFENFVFIQAALFRFKRFAKAAGVEMPSPYNRAILEALCKELVGTQVGGTIGHRPYNGEMQANIQKYFEFGTAGEIEESGDEDKKQAKPASSTVTNGKSVTNGKAAKPAPKDEPEDEEEDEDEDDDEDEDEDDDIEAADPKKGVREGVTEAAKSNSKKTSSKR